MVQPVVAGIEDQHFFELAATIIPIILFGSVLARAFHPPGDGVQIGAIHGVLAILLALYIIGMASAEMLAIAATVGGGATEAIRIIVAVALVVEVFGFGLAILVPWALRFHSAGQTHWVIATLIGIVSLVTFAWGSVLLIEFALEGSDEINTEARYHQEREAADQAYLEWSRAEITAHADHRLSKLEKHDLAILWKRKVAARRRELGLFAP